MCVFVCMTGGGEVCHVYLDPCMCVCVVFLTNKPLGNKRSRLICTSLHRISINSPAIDAPGTLITLLLQSPNNSVQTSENKDCTQLLQKIRAARKQQQRKNSNLLILISAGLPGPTISELPLFPHTLLMRTPLHQIKVFQC